MANMTKNASGNWVYNSSDNSSHTLSTKNLYLDGNIVINGAGALTAGSGSASLSGSNATLSSTNTSGVSVTATGSGSVSCGTGWKYSESKSSNSAQSTKYLTGVTINKPSSGTNKFSITVPNGASIATFMFNVDSSGNVTITEL